jgi:flagellar M-ring protein FliF
VAVGVAIALGLVVSNMGAQPQSLLYSNLDLKEASEITASLDQSGIKYEAKGDGSTIMVERDQVATARLMLATKGLPTSGSVGYEIFDNAPALGQTEFVQNLNNQRALEGELARDIRSIRGITMAKVRLVMPKRELFEEQAQQPTASVVLGLNGSGLNADQVNAIRHYVSGAVPNLKPSGVTIVDDRNRLLAAGGEEEASLGAMGAQRRTEIEDTLRKRVKDIVEGVVGPGAARVMVTADIDLTSKTEEAIKFDPDGQVVVSSGTTDARDASTDPSTNGAVTAAANIPGGQQPNGTGATTNNSNQTSETTNFQNSSIKTTTVTPAGTIKRLSVSVAVDDSVTPGKDAKSPDTYQKRSADEMEKIRQLVSAAVGAVDQTATNPEGRKDEIIVTNVRFNHAVGDTVGGTAAKDPLLDFSKNDIMRGVELVILLLVALLIIFFIGRPMLKYVGGGASVPALTAAGQPALAAGQAAGMAALEGPAGDVVPYAESEQRIDMVRIEGQVKASSVKKVSEFVDRHPEESVAILRSWLHDS